MPLVVLALLLCLTGCTPQATTTFKEATPASETCKQLTLAGDVLQTTEDTMREQYDDEYFEGDQWTAFVDGYWSGFWEEHKHCKICQTNGDVPQE